MRKLLVYMKDYKKESFLAPLFKLLEATFELIVPLVIAQIIDVAFRPVTPASSSPAVCFWLGSVWSACQCHHGAVFCRKGCRGLCHRAASQLVPKINGLSFSLLDRVGTSTLLTRITNDVNQVQNGVNLVLRCLCARRSLCSAHALWRSPLIPAARCCSSLWSLCSPLWYSASCC